MKFSDDVLVIDKRYAEELDQKVRAFRRYIQTGKTLVLTMAAAYRRARNTSYTGRVVAEVTMDALLL